MLKLCIFGESLIEKSVIRSANCRFLPYQSEVEYSEISVLYFVGPSGNRQWEPYSGLEVCANTGLSYS